MAEIVSENGWISNFKGLVTLTLALDQAILHTIMHRSSTSTYTPNFTEIKETFCGWMDVRKHIRTDGQTFETGFIRLTLSKSRRLNLTRCKECAPMEIFWLSLHWWQECWFSNKRVVCERLSSRILSQTLSW